jgi:hypothetical protein
MSVVFIRRYETLIFSFCGHRKPISVTTECPIFCGVHFFKLFRFQHKSNEKKLIIRKKITLNIKGDQFAHQKINEKNTFLGLTIQK